MWIRQYDTGTDKGSTSNTYLKFQNKSNLMNTRMRTGGQKGAKFAHWFKQVCAQLSFPFFFFRPHINICFLRNMSHKINLHCFYLIKMQRHIRVHQNYLIISTKKNNHNFHLEHIHICTIYLVALFFTYCSQNICTATFWKLVQQSKHTVSCMKIHGALKAQTNLNQITTNKANNSIQNS